MSRWAYSAAGARVLPLHWGEFVLRITSNDRQERDDCVAQARAAREAGARFFQVYLPLDDSPVELWLRADEQTSLVRALEAWGWSLDEIGYVSEPVRDSFYGVIAPSGRTVAAIFTFTACSGFGAEAGAEGRGALVHSQLAGRS